MELALNKTLIILIPKISAPERINQFQPITLCNVLYKIITKVLVNRLRPLMVKITSLSQASFVFGEVMWKILLWLRKWLLVEGLSGYKNWNGH